MTKILNKGLALLLATVLALSLSGALITAFADNPPAPVAVPAVPGLESVTGDFISLYFICPQEGHGDECCSNVFRLTIFEVGNRVYVQLYHVANGTETFILEFEVGAPTDWGGHAIPPFNWPCDHGIYKLYSIVFFERGNELLLEGSRLYAPPCTYVPPPRKHIEVIKLWRDYNNQPIVREGSIQVQLYRDGVPYLERDDRGLLTLSAGYWTNVFEDLYVYCNVRENHRFVYTLREVNVRDGYNASYGRLIQCEEYGTWSITVTNTMVRPEEPPPPPVNRFKNLEFVKLWDDDNNPNRPDYILVELRRDGVVYPGYNNGNPVTLSYPDWSYTFVGLHYVVDDRRHEFTPWEIVPVGYEKGYNYLNGVWTITNTLIPEHGSGNGNGGPPAGTAPRTADPPAGTAPRTGNFVAFLPLISAFLLSISSVLGGMSLKRKLKK